MITIIGGGISGLSLAYYLARQGESVSLYEASDRLGGSCAWTQLGDSVVDSFYHVLTGGENPLRELMDDLSLEEAIFPVAITQGFYRQGKLYPASGLKDYLIFGAFGPPDRLRLAWTVLRAALTRDWRPLDRQTAHDWLVKIGGQNLYETFWLPVMTCKFGAAVDRVAATDMWFRIHRLGEVTVFRGKERGGACYIKGTLRLFFDKLEGKLVSLGVKIYKGASVECINLEGQRLASLVLENGQTVSVDRLVCALPVAVLRQLLPESLAQYRSELGRIEYLRNICLILKTEKPITPYYQLNLGEADFPFTGLIGADCFYPPDEFGGYVTYMPRYFQGQDELFAKNQAELLSDYLPFIKRICPDFSESWIKATTLVKAHYTDVLHTPGFSEIIPAAQTPVQGLYLLSMAQIYPEPTILEHAVARARLLAERITSSPQSRRVRGVINL